MLEGAGQFNFAEALKKQQDFEALNSEGKRKVVDREQGEAECVNDELKNGGDYSKEKIDYFVNKESIKNDLLSLFHQHQLNAGEIKDVLEKAKKENIILDYSNSQIEVIQKKNGIYFSTK